MAQSFIFGSVVGLGVMTLAVDTGLMYGAKQELQSTADATALAVASGLGSIYPDTFPTEEEAARLANHDNILGTRTDRVESDLIYGHAALKGDKYVFLQNQKPYNAIRVFLHRDQSVSDGPISLLFAKIMGMNRPKMQASSTAMLVPRDIGLVIDLSGEMNDNRQQPLPSDRPSDSNEPDLDVQLNLDDVWPGLPFTLGNIGAGIDNKSQPQDRANSQKNQQAEGPVMPPDSSSINHRDMDIGVDGFNLSGLRLGWMAGDVVPHPTGADNTINGDRLYYIPRYRHTTDLAVIKNLIQADYSAEEREVLLDGMYDNSTLQYQRRVKVLLGLTEWDGKKRSPKSYISIGYSDNKVDRNELTHEVSYPFSEGSWDEYIQYVSSISRMSHAGSHLRYRYGVKTLVNYLREWRDVRLNTQEMASPISKLNTAINAPDIINAEYRGGTVIPPKQKPVDSVYQAVEELVKELIHLGADDHLSIESFAQYGTHRMDLSVPRPGQSLAEVLKTIPPALLELKPRGDISHCNIGAGLDRALNELTQDRARSEAEKLIIIFTTGKANVDESNHLAGDDDSRAIAWAEERSDAAKEMGIKIYVVGVGKDVHEDLLEDIATSPGNYFFADEAPDPNHDGELPIVSRLNATFKRLAGDRSVRLIR